ncbi:MAG: hypothetical protein HKP22_13545, partial [Gammaproteobacteria bacterium]|nr:hypothetical protein [Gammaproteobacteria bacterium]
MTRFVRQAAVLVHALIGLTLLSTSAMAETPFPTIDEAAGEAEKCIHPTDD